MSKYYNTDPIQLTLNTELDLTSATNCYIKYKVNNGTAASIVATKYNTTYVQATIPKDTVTAGTLEYQPYVSWDDGEIYYDGDKGSQIIDERIEV